MGMAGAMATMVVMAGVEVAADEAELAGVGCRE